MICRDGRRETHNFGPSRARMTGGGGGAITQPFKRKHVNPPMKRSRLYPICGEPLARLGEPCARRAGHAQMHRSARAVELDNARRRRIYARGEA